MELIYGGVVLVLLVVAHVTGVARGRYGDKRVRLLGYKKCGCGHGNNYHRNGNKGSCAWEGWSEKYHSNMECACKQFTPVLDD